MKKRNLNIYGIAVEEENHKTTPEEIFHTIIKENFPHLRKEIPIQDKRHVIYHSDMTKIETRQIIVKTTQLHDKDNVLRASREKKVMFKGKPIKITADFPVKIVNPD